MSHSLLPWKYANIDQQILGTAYIADNAEMEVASFLSEIDAKFICLTVNHHEELVAALKEAFALKEIFALQIQKRNYGNAIATHMALISWAEKYSPLLAKLEADKPEAEK